MKLILFILWILFGDYLIKKKKKKEDEEAKRPSWCLSLDNLT